jgi:hypothetical protein
MRTDAISSVPQCLWGASNEGSFVHQLKRHTEESTLSLASFATEITESTEKGLALLLYEEVLCVLSDLCGKVFSALGNNSKKSPFIQRRKNMNLPAASCGVS